MYIILPCVFMCVIQLIAKDSTYTATTWQCQDWRNVSICPVTPVMSATLRMLFCQWDHVYFKISLGISRVYRPFSTFCFYISTTQLSSELSLRSSPLH